MKKPAKEIKLPPALPRPSQYQCFRCDGTGRLCDICGESPKACCCEKDGIGDPTYSDCQDCGGKGR